MDKRVQFDFAIEFTTCAAWNNYQMKTFASALSRPDSRV